MKQIRGIVIALMLIFGMTLLPGVSFAAAPVVKTVPWVATNPLIAHDTFPGKTITLKGTSDIQASEVLTGTVTYSWDFGDGTAPATGTVTNKYAIEATHTYAGPPTNPTLTIFTARLTVVRTDTGATGSKEYYVEMQAKSLPVEVNVAIDEGLWYLHKDMTREGTPYDDGYWAHNYNTETPANLNAFFVNGHLETGADSNPYTETVRRGMRYLFRLLNTIAISNQTYPSPIGTVNPDGNGNGIGIYGYDSYVYSTGIFLDAIVASGTTDAVTTTGGTNIVGRKYKDIVQDMVDFYAFAQTDSGTWMGGWGYNENNGNSDNSVNQWASIGLLGAQSWGIATPQFVKDANMNSLNNTQASTTNCGASYDGAFAYTNNYCYFPWGPYGTTPAGMVQMVLDGIGRGNSQWDRTENFIRNNFCNTGNSNSAIRDYYYGLFSFTKAMLLTPGGGIQFLTNRPAGSNPIDWYSAEASAGDQCDGVARTLINGQLAAGNWGLHNVNGYHTYFSTAWAIIMLNRTVFASGLPVAVAKAIPNPAVATQIVTLDGSGSFHQDATKWIVKWEWDLDNNGSFETVGVTTTYSWPSVGNYPVKLRVTDNVGKTAETTIIVNVAQPPLAPTADAGGPYVFCLNKTPFFLDGSNSKVAGTHDPSGPYPNNTITLYAWDLNGDGVFGDKTGVAPDVTSYFTGVGVGSYLISLKVTDNSAASFPNVPSPQNLTSLPDSAQVFVKASTDQACVSCIADLAARAKPGEVQLTWTNKPAADHYNIYRSLTSGGPYVLIGTTKSTYSTYLDKPLANNKTYYYVVREAALNSNEFCQSNQASAKPVTR